MGARRRPANGVPTFTSSVCCSFAASAWVTSAASRIHLADLREGMQLSEMNHERYWLPRLPNTLAWLHSEMFDIEEALRLNLEGSIIAREMHFPEGDVNSQINLALNYLSLGEPDQGARASFGGRNVARRR